jgi:glycerate dehydrogenase
MKIVFLDQSTLGEISLEKFDEIGDVTIYDKTAPEQTQERIERADIIITNKVVISKAMMQNAKQLKLICVAATGVNNIDLNAAKEMHITVANVAGYSTESVVAQTFALYFACAHNSKYYDEYAKNSWSKSAIFTHFTPTYSELFGKKWGIIGLGSIGRRVATIVEAFGCEVSYYSTSGKNSSKDYTQKSLDALLSESDIISIHAPLNSDTLNLIDAQKLKRMKASGIILNLGRGGIINEQDLADVLDLGLIQGAGVDVLSTEPPTKEQPLLNLNAPERLTLSPHLAWAGVEARTRLVQEIFENIVAFSENRERNKVN